MSRDPSEQDSPDGFQLITFRSVTANNSGSSVTHRCVVYSSKCENQSVTGTLTNLLQLPDGGQVKRKEGQAGSRLSDSAENLLRTN